MGSLCAVCPDGIRGLCCHIAMPIDGFNVILDHVVCPNLNLETKKCKVYDTRLENHWCLPDEEMFNKGGLPEGCLYLKEHPEDNPKISIQKIIEIVPMSPRLHMIVAQYNIANNVDFMAYTNFTVKNKEAKV
jgi:uncharacterized cysteine cluster protein YcgN (CxxCxxCC family)